MDIPVTSETRIWVYYTWFDSQNNNVGFRYGILILCHYAYRRKLFVQIF